MELVTIVSMLALLQAVVFGMLVGRARGQYNIKAPAVSGNEMFERYYRVHYNTIEQLILFLPAIWAFGYYIGQYWAAGIGAVYLVGRIVYATSYIKEPASRGVGTLLSMVPTWVLILGALIGAIVQML